MLSDIMESFVLVFCARWCAVRRSVGARYRLGSVRCATPPSNGVAQRTPLGQEVDASNLRSVEDTFGRAEDCFRHFRTEVALSVCDIFGQTSMFSTFSKSVEAPARWGAGEAGRRAHAGGGPGRHPCSVTGVLSPLVRVADSA